MNYEVKSNKITFSNGNFLEFEHPIKSVLAIQEVIVILVDPPFNGKYDLNVFAVATNGEFLWRIGRINLYYMGPDCPYVGMNISKDGEIVLFNWCDTAVVIDPLTGKVIRTYITK